MELICATDYLLEDAAERRLIEAVERCDKDGEIDQKLLKKLKILQEKNRGIYVGRDGRKGMKYLKFAKYFFRRCAIFCVGANTFYAYSHIRHCYEVVQERTLHKLFSLIVQEWDENFYSVSVGNSIFQAVSEEVEEYVRISETPGIIVFRNGTLYLHLKSEEKMEFRTDFSKEDIVFHSLPYNYNPDADCPCFKDFLAEIMCGDTDLTALLRDCCANIFAFGEVYVHHLVFLWGNGRNGKSVLCDLLAYLVPDMVSTVRLSKLSDRFGLSELEGKVANISQEAGAEIRDTEAVKEISAGSTTSIERKFQDSFSARITAKLFVATNEFPRTKDTSKGWADRLTIIPFEQTFEVMPADGQKVAGKLYQNPYLLDELKKEREGIAAWLLSGLQDLKERRWVLTHSKRAGELKQRVLMESQPVLWFFRCCMRVKKDGQCRTSKTHAAFKNWAEQNGVCMLKFSCSKEFHAELRRILEMEGLEARPREVRGYQYYKGVMLEDNSADGGAI